MVRWLKSPLGVGTLVATLLFALAFFGPLDLGLRYLHFSTLTKDRLVREMQAYIRERASGFQFACLYVVRCDGNAARLELIADVDAWDFEATKRAIWQRRFSNFCSGRTANFGLHLIPMEGHEPRIDAVSYARWSFFNDRFIPRSSRFHSGSFSDQTWDQCTKEKAIASWPQ